MYAVLVVTPAPLFSAKLRFKRGGVTTREYGICAYICDDLYVRPACIFSIRLNTLNPFSDTILMILTDYHKDSRYHLAQ